MEGQSGDVVVCGKMVKFGKWSVWYAGYDDIFVCSCMGKTRIVQRLRIQYFSSSMSPGTCNVLKGLVAKGLGETYVLAIRYTDGDVELCIGGRIEKGEASGKAAVRELREETGIKTSEKMLELLQDSKKDPIYGLCLTKKPDISDILVTPKSGPKTGCRVSTIVYGSKELITSMIQVARPTDTTEQIMGYVMVPLCLAASVAYRFVGPIEYG